MNLGTRQVIWMSSHWRHWGVPGKGDHLKTRLKFGELLWCGASHSAHHPIISLSLHASNWCHLQPLGGVQAVIPPALGFTLVLSSLQPPNSPRAPGSCSAQLPHKAVPGTPRPTRLPFRHCSSLGLGYGSPRRVSPRGVSAMPWPWAQVSNGSELEVPVLRDVREQVFLPRQPLGSNWANRGAQSGGGMSVPCLHL